MNRPWKICKGILAGMAILLIFNGCYKENILPYDNGPQNELSFLRIDQSYGFVDSVDHIIMFTLGADSLKSFAPHIYFNGYTSVRFKGKTLINNQANELGEVRVNNPYQILAGKNQHVDTCQLIFTRFPLMHILVNERIPDEPKILSRLWMQYPDSDNADATISFLNTYAGIEIRGGSSLRYDKKSFGLELWKNAYGDDYSTSLLGMRPGEDWILDAMYIDGLRMRNKVSFELWEKISSTPEEDAKPEVFPGIESRFVELFINHRYHGLYCLGEKMTEKTLHFALNQDEKGGVMYKGIDWSDGSTRFDTYHSEPPDGLLWDGWELIYPKDVIVWDPLAELRQFVVLSEDEDFENEIASFIDMDNAVQYYLFINLLLAHDNTGKNTYLARYTDQSHFFIMPWDMDYTWGLVWERSRVAPTGIASNNLFKRLVDTDTDDFNSRLETRWSELRSEEFSNNSLLDPISAYYQFLKGSGAIERENARWEDIQIDLDEEYEYITTWIESRLQYLDVHFD